MNAIAYRPDIDGLRAVAIVPVILFHLGAGWLPGGYLGVDVFFVISGFLITSILLREMTAGQFSFRRFWSRRIRRIVPALVVVTAATLVATWILVFPPDRPAIGRQAGATLLSVANFYFWRHAGDYWGPQAEDSPFLHAWSLAVEEQFYIFFPLVLYLIVRWIPRRIVFGLLTILVCSLCLFLYGVHARPAATFYLLPTRAWELATGALLAAALNSGHAARVPGWAAAALGGGGLGAVVASYVCLPTLSGWAVVPVMGAAVVIWCGTHGWVKALLSHPALVYVGKISYSLYLWHWPVIVLSRNLSHDVASLVLVLLIGLLAMASYHLIEEPIRRHSAGIPRIACGFASVLGLATALVCMRPPTCDVSAFERPQTFSRFYDLNPHRAETAEWAGVFASADAPASCALPDSYRSEGIVVGTGEGLPEVVVLGDSHGCMWADAIRTAAEDAGLKAAFFCMGGEPPFISFPPSRSQSSRKLTAAEKYDFDLARIRSIERWKPEVVIICARWAVVKPGEADGLLAFLQDHVKRIVLFEQPPELAGVGNHSVAEFAAFRGITPKPEVRQFWTAGNTAACEAGRRLVNSLATRFRNCEILATMDLFDATGRVCFLDGAALLYLDDDHLTTKGAKLALPRIRQCLSPQHKSVDIR